MDSVGRRKGGTRPIWGQQDEKKGLHPRVILHDNFLCWWKLVNMGERVLFHVIKIPSFPSGGGTPPFAPSQSYVCNNNNNNQVQVVSFHSPIIVWSKGNNNLSSLSSLMIVNDCLIITTRKGHHQSFHPTISREYSTFVVRLTEKLNWKANKA